MSGGPIGILANPAFMDAMADPRAAQQYQPRGILGQFDQFAQNNSAALLGLGAGLLSGDGFGAGAQGYAQGMQQDQRTRILKQKEAEEARRRQAGIELANKLGKPELAEFPEIASSLYLAQNKPHGPLEIERQLDAAGIKDPAERQAIIRRQVVGDPKLQEFDPDKTYAVRDSNAPGGFRIVSPFGTSPTVAAGSTDDAIPPPPPGADPKAWRTEQTKIAAQRGQQTTQQINDLAKAEKAAADLAQSVDRYKELVAGTEAKPGQPAKPGLGAEAWNGPDKARVGAAYTDVLIKMKEAANLGVLNGPDLELMQKQLEDAQVTGFDRVNPFKQWGIADRISAQAEEIKKSTQRGLENARKSYGGKQPSASQAVKGTTRSGIGWSAN